MGIVPDLKHDVWKFTPVEPVVSASAIQTTSDLSSDEQTMLSSFLREQWARMGTSLGCTTRVEHEIVTDAAPIKQRYYPVSPVIQQHINAELDTMLENDVIEPSASPWSSPILMVAKKDGSYRFCVDFRRINQVTKKDAYPLPFVSAILNRLRGARYISSLDLKSAYWQIPVKKECREITAFTVPGRGLFQFKRMPFGLSNAPATWQRLINDVLGMDLEPHVFVYLDDIIVVSQTFEQHMELLRKIFDRLANAGLTVSQEKSVFCRPETRYLGYVVDKRGLRVDPEKVEAILNIPAPKTVKDVRSFIGMTSWYRRFVPNFSSLISPLTQLLRKNNKFVWTEERQRSFDLLKESLISAPILTCPDFTKPFVVQTDASSFGLGAVLSQTFEDGEKVIAYLSRSLTKAERNYTTTERECLAVLWSLDRLRPYIEGSSFTVITDHQSLLWLLEMKEPTGRLCRWSVKLQRYDFNIIHRKGKEHVVPDCLSRSVPTVDEITVQDEHVAPSSDSWYRKMRLRVEKNQKKFSQWRLQVGKLYKYVSSKVPALDDDELSWKEVIPKDKRRDILVQAHSVPTSGHPGAYKTYHKLAKRFYWPKMKSDVAAFVRKCTVCLEQKPVQKKPAGLMGKRPSVYRPFQMISADLIGPLPPTSRGFRFILVVSDYFSKLVLTFAMRTASASMVTRHLEENVFLLFGVPQYLICDNGVQFKSNQFRNLCRKHDVTLLYNALYHPQNNPTERVNRVVKTMLSAYVKQNHRLWDQYLPSVSCAIRTLQHEVTGCTPFFANFGREHILSGSSYPVGAFDPNSVVSFDREKLPERPEGFRQLYGDIRKRLDAAYERSKVSYNLRRRPEEYDVGQMVWRKNFSLSSAANYFAHKLAPKYVGPFRVKKKLSRLTYELTDENDVSKGIWHVKDLKLHPVDDDLPTVDVIS